MAQDVPERTEVGGVISSGVQSALTFYKVQPWVQRIHLAYVR